MRTKIREILHKQYLKILLIALTLLIVGRPLAGTDETGRILQTGLFTVVLFTSCLSLQRRLFLFIALGAAMVVNLVWSMSALNSHPFFCTTSFQISALLAAILFLTISGGAIVKRVFSRGLVDTNKICGAIVVYLLIGLIFGLLFECALMIEPGCLVSTTSELALTNPESFKADMLVSYFSFVTLTTLGYGDVVPVSITTRTLALVEAVVGQLFIAILIARLVSLSIVHESMKDTDAASGS